jgi:DNA-binding Lrp family transcriptional regulator
VTESLDRQVVAALCRDGRADVRSLAAETDAVATTVQKRLRALESDGVIEGYAARLNYDRIGYETVVVRLAVDLDVVDDVLARLRDRREFVTVYQTSGEYTVFAVGKFETASAVADCLRDLHDDPDVDAVELDSVTSVVGEGRSPLPEA